MAARARPEIPFDPQSTTPAMTSFSTARDLTHHAVVLTQNSMQVLTWFWATDRRLRSFGAGRMAHLRLPASSACWTSLSRGAGTASLTQAQGSAGSKQAGQTAVTSSCHHEQHLIVAWSATSLPESICKLVGNTTPPPPTPTPTPSP